MTSAVATPSVSVRRPSPRLRVALDVIRALSAVYVVIHHVVVNSTMTGLPQVVFKYGPQAVIVFFLLSGFVIFANESTRVQKSATSYYLRRLRRIYPPLLVAFAVSALVAWLDGTLVRDFSPLTLGLNLLSLQDLGDFKPGVIAYPFLGNGPLWSLSYEVLFYLAFPLIMSAHRRSAGLSLGIVGSLSVIGFGTYVVAPNHFSLVFAYMLTWWAGAVIAELYGSDRLSLRAVVPVGCWLVALCAVAGAGVLLNRHPEMVEILRLSLNLFVFALACVAASTTVLARYFVRVAAPLAVPAAFTASISYGLYVFHFPLLVQWDFAKTPLGLAVAAVLLLVISVVGDRSLERWIPKP